MSSTRKFTPDMILSRSQEPLARSFEQILSEFSAVDLSSLLKQLSLHMPQYTWEENLSKNFIHQEAYRLASRLQSLRIPYLKDIPGRNGIPLMLQNLEFCVLDNQTAQIILERFHYLLSFRENSIHLGFKAHATDNLPIAMVTLSPFDLSNVTKALHLVNDEETIPIVLSRAFAFDVAPQNTISNLLSKVRTWISMNLAKTNLLVTYLNPNVGFTGASYKADNWNLLGKEGGTRYYYIHRNYVTDRKIYSHFGKNPLEIINSWQEYGITVSKYKLLPLELYIRGIPRNRKWPIEERKFRRWAPPSDPKHPYGR
jgi:hypothetical protein